jgi:primosomal protein N' (replication factor Y)
MMHAVECVVEHKSLSLNQRFTYLAPTQVKRGMRVEVDFNRQACVALVLAVRELNDPALKALGDEHPLKPIVRALDDEVLLNEELMDLGLWLAEHSLAPIISCFQVMLPKAKQIASNATRVQLERWVRVSQLPAQASAKQTRVLEALKGHAMRYRLAKDQFGGAVDTLIRKGVLTLYTKEKQYQTQRKEKRVRPYELSSDQQAALNAIAKRPSDTVCLYGPTGSGKTEIYLALAEQVQARGQEILIMVPEIALTHQMVERVEARFGEDVIVYHSNLSAHERYLQYQRVLQGQAKIVIGTRSSVFLPFKNLAYIVMDEEHDHSYKQEAQPYYHARDVALRRVAHFKAGLILGSATPSFDTYARALKGTYGLIELNHRIKGELPKLSLVGNRVRTALIQPAILEALKACLARSEQAIVLINRRGYAPLMECVACHHVLSCDACDRALVWHAGEARLKCHACGAQHAKPPHCPHCQSPHLRILGYGSERIEEAVRSALPEARIARMDRDTTRAKNAHQKILSAFERHELDVLIGTQMIAKGLDVEKVTLSVVLDIDRSLMRSDYRSLEDAFSLIVQTAGRSGRSSRSSDVLIQTNHPDHPLLKDALTHNYKNFFRREMKTRQLAQNPPYTYLISVVVFAREQHEGLRTAYALKEALSDARFQLLGPSDLGKVQNRHRVRLLIKGKDFEAMRQHVQTVLRATRKLHRFDVIVDTHPLNLI